MAVTIKLKNASGSDPSASDLVVGEVAIRTDNGKLFTKKDNGSVAEITGGGGIDDGDKGDITVSNSGGTFTIDNGVIVASKIASDAITTNKIANLQVTDVKLADNSLALSKFPDGVITNAKINASAAIAVSKLSGVMPLAGGAFTGDITTRNMTPPSGVTNIDIGSSSLKYRNIFASGNITVDGTITGASDSSDAAFIAKGDGTNTGTSGYLQLNCSLNSHGIKLSSPPHSAAATYTFTFPTDIQSGKYLSVDSNGQTSWGTPTDNNFTDALLSKLNGIAASATNVTNNNQLTNGAGYITATLTNEQVQDIVGNMVSSNTESGITVTYQDSDGTLDFSVASQTDENFTTTLKNKLDGIAANATNVTNNNQLTNGAGYITSAALSGAGDGGNAALLDGVDSTQFVRADQDDTLTGNLTLSSSSQDIINFSASSTNDRRGIAFNSRTALSADHNDGYLRLNDASEFSNGVYTPLVMRADGGFNVDGNTVITGSGTIPYSKLTGTPTIPTNNNQLTNGAGYITSASDGTKLPLSGGELSGDLITHNVRPDGNNSRNLGSTSNRWANVYVNDMHLSNKGKSNDVDGSWGDWTIQEGKTSLFIINNRNGKKYSINLTEVS